MNTKIVAGHHLFEVRCDLLDVTSNHRPNTAWRTVDAKHHAHQWYNGGQPARSYSPTVKYITPTLVWVKDGEEYWEDDDQPHEVGHLECDQCGERVSPGYTADTLTQHIAGMRHYTVNGKHVTEEEFKQQYMDATGR